MSLKTVLVIGLIVSGAFAFAQTDQEEPKLGVEFDATWVSKYIWRGMDLYDDHAAFQPSIDFDLFQTGFSVNVWGSTACSSGYVNSDELDYSVAYSNSLFNDSKFKTEYSLGWVYYDYPRISSDVADSQEFIMSLTWPEICSFGVVPTYTVAYLYPAESSTAVTTAPEIEGFAHILGLTYDLDIPELDMPLTLSWDITYNDGYGGASVDHDWSHITWGVSSSFDIGPGSFTPAVYYQSSMDDSVNTEDEFWTGLSYTFGF